MEIGHRHPGGLYPLYTDSFLASPFENSAVGLPFWVGLVGWVGVCLAQQLEMGDPKTEQLFLCSWQQMIAMSVTLLLDLSLHVV